MGHMEKQSFIATLRSSPRRRRKAAWLVGVVVAVAAIATVALLLPNTAGKPQPIPKSEGGTGLFWIVASVLLIGFFVALAFALVRVVWRIERGDDDPARPGAYTFPHPRIDEIQVGPSPE
jgi:hypothetical protein